MVDKGAITPLVRLLKSSNSKTQEHVIKALNKIVLTSKELAKKVVASSILSQLGTLKKSICTQNIPALITLLKQLKHCSCETTFRHIFW